MTKTVFAPAMPVTSAWLNSIQTLRFTQNPNNDGEYPLITNDDLDDTPGQIKPDYFGFRDALKVSASVGLAIAWNAGFVTLESGLIQTYSPGTMLVPDNSIVYVFIDTAGQITVSPLLPVRWFPLARVTTGNGAIVLIEDLRERFKVGPRAKAIAAFGSGGYEGDLVITANATLGGVRYVRDFTVDAGVQLNVTSGFLYVKASGNVLIRGSISANPVVSGAVGFNGALSSPFTFFGEPGSGLGRSGGVNTLPPPTYPYQASFGLGSGGSVGFASCFQGTGGGIGTGKAGNGGGAIWIEAAGTITVEGTLKTSGEHATQGTVNRYGTSENVLTTGNSAGTGGTIWLGALGGIVVTASATIEASGGNSASGLKLGSTASLAGPGGPSGGYVVFNSESMSISLGASVSVAGGLGGASVPGTLGSFGSTPGPSFGGIGGAPGSGGGNGQNGSAGQIIEQLFAPI